MDEFTNEIALIKDETLRQVVNAYMNVGVPKYFYSVGASITGRFHPEFAKGEGGLVRHTKAVVKFAQELLRLSLYSYMKDEYKDYVIAACIIHDTAKYGINEEPDRSLYADHAENAAKAFNSFAQKYYGYQPSELLLNAVKAHMGQWTTNREDRPFTNIDRCVHLADYIASRSFIDIKNF
jgi:HD superfamily phosphohydrolase YqeK